MYKVLIVEDDPMVAMINEQYILKNKDISRIINERLQEEIRKDRDFVVAELKGHGVDAE